MEFISKGKRFHNWQFGVRIALINWFRQTKQRKKRKKRNKPKILKSAYLITNSYDHEIMKSSMPRIVSLLILMPIILDCLQLSNVGSSIKVRGQLVVEHPKSRISLEFSRPIHPTTQRDYGPNFELSSIDKRSSGEQSSPSRSADHVNVPDNIANDSTMPTSKDKQNELLRRLSSTMLLETLLRHPISIKNSPFPTLPLPTIRESPPYSLNIDQISPKRIRKRPLSANRNVTRIISEPKIPPSSILQYEKPTFLEKNRTALSDILSPKQDLFNSSTLNYLVDKLLSSKAINESFNVTRKRPANRDISPTATTSKGKKRSSPQDPILPSDLQNLKDTDLTLDMLIKDEYDSRVEPMLKSLSEQQRLSSTNSDESMSTFGKSTSIYSPANHRSDIKVSGSHYSSTTSPLSSVEHSLMPILPAFMHAQPEQLSPQILTMGSDEPGTMIAFENFDDDDDSEDEEENDHKAMVTGRRNMTAERRPSTNLDKRKKGQIVPPYQLTNTDFVAGPDRPKPPKLNIPEAQASTNPPIDQLRSGMALGVGYDGHLGNVRLMGEKTADATNRGSLVYSDGYHEAERASRKRAQSAMRAPHDRHDTNSISRNKDANTDSPDNNMGVTVSSLGHDDKLKESFLLNQLFSTANPLTDLDLRLKEQFNNRDSSQARNPLIYKGYVGRDDFMPASDSAGDWSRPISSGEAVDAGKDAVPATMLKAANSDDGHPFGVSAPPTEPPSVPYNYFLHQPVTNAQSMPSMVIPASDPINPFTSQSPRYSARFPQREPVMFGMNSISRSSPLPSTNGAPDEQRYSYQLPVRPQINLSGNSVIPNISISDVINLRPHLPAIRAPTNESMAPFNRTLLTQQRPATRVMPAETDPSWTPSRIATDEASTSIQKRKQQSHYHEPPTGGTARIAHQFNSTSSPIQLVPIIGAKAPMGANSPGLSQVNQSRGKVSAMPDSGGTDNDQFPGSSLAATTQRPVMQPQPARTAQADDTNLRGKNSEPGEDGEARRNMFYAQHRISLQRNRSKQTQASQTGSSSPVSPPLVATNDGLLGDTESEPENTGVKRVKQQPLGANRQRNQSKRPSLMDGQDNEFPVESTSDKGGMDPSMAQEISSADQAKQKPARKQTIKHRHDASSESPAKSAEDGKLSSEKTHKGGYLESHEQAGSEIQLTGLPDAHKRNLTITITARPSAGVLNGDGSDTSYIPVTPSSSGPSLSSSFGSTIIPSTNFYGEASSESPTLDNPISVLNQNAPDKIGRASSSANGDLPFERGSNGGSVLAASSTTVASSTGANNRLQTSTPQTIIKQHEDPISTQTSSGSAKLPVTPNSKTSNDRLAFILIGGSCALSVVCLVLAAMSMRCQDMCDDYRSLRNAERAALKLQKHRLKYTKNHQINRLHCAQTPATNVKQSLIDELNALESSPGLDSEPNLARNAKCLTNNSKSMQAHSEAPHFKQSQDSGLNVWSSANCQLGPLSSVVNKEAQICRFGNCAGHRWMCQDDMIVGNKHISWLHPHYYQMQQQAPLRPLFGVGSSVGTFFPRRGDNQGLLASSAVLDAGQPGLSCSALADQRAAVRSKSILHKSNKLYPKPPIDNFGNTCDLMQSYECNNPDHSHSHQHICHNHQTNKFHAQHLGTSASEDGKLTLDEAVHLCDRAECSNHHHHHHHHHQSGLSHRLKLMQLRSNGLTSFNNHISGTGWKLDSTRKNGPNYPNNSSSNSSSNNNNNTHHHLHHHHLHGQHHQQQVSSSDSSSLAQCTCSHDSQPLLVSKGKSRQHTRTSHKLLHKHDARINLAQQAKRDEAMLVWSTNRDRLI